LRIEGLGSTLALDPLQTTNRDDSRQPLDPERLRRILPDSPGVYLFKDPNGRVIYVGKAKNLKKRVLSYFKPADDLPHKTALMMKRASGLEHILTSSEKEAFILERPLIQKHMPRYNVILRDDKQYPCLRLDVETDYPRLSIVRKIRKDGALYFGPFSSAHAVRSTLKLIERVFPIRQCKGRGIPSRSRPCLNYEMDRCLGPCTQEVPKDKYAEVVEQVKLFLEGRNRELIEDLREKMSRAAESLDFERAAKIRDRIRAVEKTVERQHVVSPRMEDQDVIGLAKRGDLYQLVILFVRKGALVGRRDYALKGQGDTPSEVMEAFLKQYYPREVFIPKWIIISDPIEDLEPITEWLSDLAGKKVSIHRPLRGDKLDLVRMAVANAENLLMGRADSGRSDLLGRAQAVLRLKGEPRRIEGLDISNFQGDMAVGTIVSFVEGAPHREGYRNYRIRAVEGIDDYGMMAELVSRRLTKGDLPDLFLVDGGKGHLSAVKRVLEQWEGTNVPEVVSIAKPDEQRGETFDKLYIPDRKNPLALGPDHPVLLLMMRIRDEAHRRAISYHRKLLGRTLTASELDLVPGIGSKRKKALLGHFRDMETLSKAKPDDLARVPGITRPLAETIFGFFQAKRIQEGENEANTG
jgi:excinuclease ABC subunit C